MIRGQHLIGKMLGSCVLERLLGYGGSSAVFLAQQHDPDRKVAVKVFLPRNSMDAQMQREFYTRFLHEAEAASQLDHPHILPIYSYGEEDGLPYIVMPYMSGGTLSEYISKHGPFSLQEAQWHLEQIASALDYAHEHGCVHCDVKPANILLDSDGRVMLSDFGIARVIRAKGGVEQPVKNTEALMGTPDYISPEQALGQSIDGRSDVYSLGITLFYMLAKCLPFKADSTIALALLHIHEPAPPLGLLRADISPAIDRVVHKALAKGPDERFQTAGEFSAAFAQAVELAEKVYATSGKVTIPARDPVTAGSGPQAILIASRPVVRVKPVRRHALSVPRLLGVAVLLLTIITATVFTTRIVSLRITTGAHSVPNALSANVNNTPMDYLANHESWPGSSTFFYDKQNQYYHIMNTSRQSVALALYTTHQFSNFRLTVTMTEIRSSHNGADYYGVVFRSSIDQSHYYLFEVVTSGNVEYVFLRYDGDRQFPWKTLATGPAPSLLTGPEKSNTITIGADGNAFTFSINGEPVSKPVTDSAKSALMAGEVGLYVEEGGDEVAFSHLYIDLPG